MTERSSMGNPEIKICQVCGEENPQDSTYCLGCGAALSDSSKAPAETKGAVEHNAPEGKESKGKNTADPDKRKKNKIDGNKEETHSKILSSKKLFYLVFSLFLLGSFLVIAAGLFDEPAAVAVSGQFQQGNSANPHSGVDLNALNEINKLEDAVKNNPNDLTSLLHLGHLLNDSGLKDKAIEKYKQYLEKDPKNADVWVDMGVCYFELGNNAQAISSMENGLKYQPRHQIANLNLGIVNATAGNAEKAKEYWKKAVEINPSNEIGRKAEELLKSH